MQNKKYLELSVTGYSKKAKTISRPLMLKSRTMYIYVCGIEQNKRFKKNNGDQFFGVNWSTNS